MITSIAIGHFQCHLLSCGTLRVDGGAMFGAVPKSIWEKKMSPDDRNCVELSINSLLIVGPSEKILVDPGIGRREARKYRSSYGIRDETALEQGLRSLQIRPEEIGRVINTHLHWDHSGANVALLPDGTLKPAFCNARYYVQQGEWESACHPSAWARENYLFQEDPVLLQSDQLELLQGDTEILPGVRVRVTPGHTPYHQSILVHSEDQTLLYPGDLIPTAAHLPLPSISALDLEPDRTYETKQKILAQAREEGWTLALCHETREKMKTLPRP